MIVTTQKLTSGKYAVIVDEKPTCLLIAKGDKPKFRERQEWSILAIEDNGEETFLCGDQRSLESARATIGIILNSL